MTKLEEVKNILDNNRAYLLEEKESILKRFKDPKVVAWRQVKLASLANLLKLLNIPCEDLQNALKNYPKYGKDISEHIKVCNNEISNQLADLIGCKSPDKALLATDKVKQGIQRLEDLKLAMYKELDLFIMADNILRQSLNIETLMPIALNLAQKQNSLFKEGVEVYRIITEKASSDNNSVSLDESCQQVAKLDSRYKNIEVLGLPRLAEEIVFHYIKIGSDTLLQILTFTKATTGMVTAEIGAIHNLNSELSALKKADTLIILKNITKHAKAISTLMCGLYHKRELKNTLAKVAETLELLNIYHLAIKNKIIPAIKEQITEPNTNLNPAVVSANMTRSFFTGPKGIIRSMKLMVKSLTGQAAINQIELQLILEKAVSNCKIFYGKSSKDIKELRLFIDDLIKQFDRPFPYDNIFMLVKNTIATYGISVEKFFKQYETKRDFQVIAKTKIPSTFDKLALKLVNKRDAFAKANK